MRTEILLKKNVIWDNVLYLRPKLILKHNYSSNAVKGNSYYFTVDDFFITSKKEQILKIGIINSWSDTDRFHSLNIEIKNLELIIENEEIGNDFWNLLKANEER